MGEFFVEDNDNDINDINLQQMLNDTFQLQQDEIIRRQFGNEDISKENLDILNLYCHFDYKKENKECCVCLDKKLSHKCHQCNAVLCKKCLIQINKNEESNQCPICRYKFSMDEYIEFTNININLILDKYGNNSIGDKISDKPIEINYNDKNETQLNGDYNYRDNKLQISSSNKELKIQLDFRKFNLKEQSLVIKKMDNICKDMISSGNEKLWNSQCNKIGKMINQNKDLNDILKS
jgi:hypothetical protein